MGFTLVELLVAIVILAVLALITLPVIRSTRSAAMKTSDSNQLRGYGVAVLSYMSMTKSVTADGLLSEETMADYVGGTDAFQRALSSVFWVRVNELPAEDNPRSYTLNSTLFRQSTAPNASKSALVATETHLIQADQNRPLLFMGIAQPGRNRAYSWGGTQHLNPVYGGSNRTIPADVPLEEYGDFSVLTLRVGGAVEFINYATNNAASWWTRDHLK